MKKYCVYILKDKSSDKYYTGYTGDLKERVRGHNRGQSPYTKGRGPWKLVYSKEYATHSEAMRVEKEIKKKKSCDYIEKLIAES